MPQRGKIRYARQRSMQQGKKLAGKQLGFLTKTGSQAQAYLGIPQTFFGSSRQSATKIEDAAHTKKMLAGTAGCWVGVAHAVRVSSGVRRSGSGWHLRHLLYHLFAPNSSRQEKQGTGWACSAVRNKKKRKGCGYLPQPLISCWCRGRESNPHGGCHYHLKIACLPIPPPERLFCFYSLLRNIIIFVFNCWSSLLLLLLNLFSSLR